MKYIVYLTTNLINHKIYVGVHGTEDPTKFDGYYGCGLSKTNKQFLINPKTPIHFAIKKYGFDNFSRSTIKIFDTEQEALDLEAEIVNEDFIAREDTYNIVLGGGMPPIHNIKCYRYNLNGILLKEYNSREDAAKELNCYSGSISNAIILKRSFKESFWSNFKFDSLNINNYSTYNPKIPIFIYDSNGNFIKQIESMSECCKFLECNLSNIQRGIKIGTSIKGYYVSDKLYSIFKKPTFERLTGLVHQYDLEGNYIKTYNSIKEVECYFKESMQGINDSIKQQKSYKNFLWRRGEEKIEKIQPYIKKKDTSGKKIGQYTIEGKLVKIFNTVREARKEFPNVSKVLKGEAKHCHGYTFKYIS